jgi:hypothetical protein
MLLYKSANMMETLAKIKRPAQHIRSERVLAARNGNAADARHRNDIVMRHIPVSSHELQMSGCDAADSCPPMASQRAGGGPFEGPPMSEIGY